MRSTGQHDATWRQDEHPKTEWTQNDHLLGMAEKGTRAIAVQDGEFLVFHKNKLTLMHGGRPDDEEEDTVDISEAFQGNDTVNDKVELADGRYYRCCCGKDSVGTGVSCALKKSYFVRNVRWLASEALKHLPPQGHILQAMARPCGMDAVEWHQVPTTEGMEELQNAGKCVIPASEVPK